MATCVELLLVALARTCDRLVLAEPAPMSVPAVPIACTPCNPKLLASTVDWLRSIATEPFCVAETPLFALPPPMKTESDFANVPPESSPMD